MYVLRYKLTSGTICYWNGFRWTIAMFEVVSYPSYQEAENEGMRILDLYNQAPEIVEIK